MISGGLNGGEVPIGLTLQVIAGAITAVMGTATLITTLIAYMNPWIAAIASLILILAVASLIADMYDSYYDYIYSGDPESYMDTQDKAFQLFMLGNFEQIISEFIFANYPARYLMKTTGDNNQTFDILSGKTLTNQTGKVDNYVSEVKGEAAARADFNAMNPTNIRSYSNGTVVGELSDGRIINIHLSTTLSGVPSVEIYDPITGTSIKIRY